MPSRRRPAATGTRGDERRRNSRSHAGDLK
jgi:hypothetical protein